jgi:hypothetical protein
MNAVVGCCVDIELALVVIGENEGGVGAPVDFIGVEAVAIGRLNAIFPNGSEL